MSIRATIHVSCVTLATLSAIFFLVYSAAGLMFVQNAETLIGTRLQLLVDEPNRLDDPTRIFLEGVDPRRLHKCLFASRQSMQFLVFSGGLFMFTSILGYMTCNKKGNDYKFMRRSFDLATEMEGFPTERTLAGEKYSRSGAGDRKTLSILRKI